MPSKSSRRRRNKTGRGPQPTGTASRQATGGTDADNLRTEGRAFQRVTWDLLGGSTSPNPVLQMSALPTTPSPRSTRNAASHAQRSADRP